MLNLELVAQLEPIKTKIFVESIIMVVIFYGILYLIKEKTKSSTPIYWQFAIASAVMLLVYSYSTLLNFLYYKEDPNYMVNLMLSASAISLVYAGVMQWYSLRNSFSNKGVSMAFITVMSLVGVNLLALYSYFFWANFGWNAPWYSLALWVAVDLLSAFYIAYSIYLTFSREVS